MKVLIINGMGGSGKDTFVKYLRNYIDLFHCSIADLPKKIATGLGWKGEKDDKSRKLLSDIKLAIDNYNDANFTYIKNKINDATRAGYKAVCVDMREANQIERAKKEFGAITVFVDRDVPKILTNPADAGVYDYKYDYVIDNNGTLEELKQKAKEFAKELNKEYGVELFELVKIDTSKKEYFKEFKEVFKELMDKFNKFMEI